MLLVVLIRNFEILLNGFAGRDALVENTLTQLPKGFSIGLRSQTFVFATCDVTGENDFDTMVRACFVINVAGT